MEGIRRLDELVATNGESVSGEVHTVALALLVEVKYFRKQEFEVAVRSNCYIKCIGLISGEKFAIPSLQGCHPVYG